MSIKKKAIVVICSLIFTGLTILYYLDNINTIDQFFYDVIIMFKSNNVTSAFKNLTMLGGVLGTIFLVIIVLLRDRKKCVYFLINIGIIMLLNVILKTIIMRERPIGINLILEKGYSFPSGHSMNSVAAYGLMIFYLYRSKLNKYIRIIGIIGSLLCMIIVPISRVYLGVHYFSDIIAGACLSLIWLMFYTEYLKRKNI